MKKQKYYAAMFAVVIGMAVVSVAKLQPEVVKAKSGLEAKVIRLHILANSNSIQDQALKLKVRDAVLDELDREVEFPKEATSSIARKKMESYIKNHKSKLRKVAEKVIVREGYHYPVKVEYKTSTFPVKTYGDVTFPAGRYQALRILIGKAEGHNWWCSLYPSLCFIDGTHPTVAEKGKKQLNGILTDEEENLVTMKTDFQFELYSRRYFMKEKQRRK